MTIDPKKEKMNNSMKNTFIREVKHQSNVDNIDSKTASIITSEGDLMLHYTKFWKFLDAKKVKLDEIEYPVNIYDGKVYQPVFNANQVSVKRFKMFDEEGKEIEQPKMFDEEGKEIKLEIPTYTVSQNENITADHSKYTEKYPISLEEIEKGLLTQYMNDKHSIVYDVKYWKDQKDLEGKKERGSNHFLLIRKKTQNGYTFFEPKTDLQVAQNLQNTLNVFSRVVPKESEEKTSEKSKEKINYSECKFPVNPIPVKQKTRVLSKQEKEQQDEEGFFNYNIDTIEQAKKDLATVYRKFSNFSYVTQDVVDYFKNKMYNFIQNKIIYSLQSNIQLLEKRKILPEVLDALKEEKSKMEAVCTEIELLLQTERKPNTTEKGKVNIAELYGDFANREAEKKANKQKNPDLNKSTKTITSNAITSNAITGNATTSNVKPRKANFNNFTDLAVASSQYDLRRTSLSSETSPLLPKKDPQKTGLKTFFSRYMGGK